MLNQAWNHIMKVIKTMFSSSAKTCKLIKKNNGFWTFTGWVRERKKVSRRYQKWSQQIHSKTMLDLCSTNDATIIRKGFKIEAEGEPTNYEYYAKVHEQNKARKYIKKVQNNMPTPGGPGSQILSSPPHFSLRSRLSRLRKPWTVPVWLPWYIHTYIYVYIYIYT